MGIFQEAVMPLRYLAYCLLAVTIWSGNTIVTKLAAGAIPPGVIAFERWLIAFVILTPFVARSAWSHREVIRDYIWKLGALGLLGMAICQGLGYYAARFTSATNMAILLSLTPLLTLVLIAVFMRERPTRLALIGGVMSLVGILIVVSKGDFSALVSHGVGRGDALMFIVVIALAGYGVLLKTWSGPMPTFTSLYVQMGWALLFLLPGYLTEKSIEFSLPNVSMTMYAAIAGSIVAPFVWMQATQALGAARISVFMNLIPIFSAIGAALLLNEALHAYHVLGGLLTVVGIIVSQRRKSTDRLPQGAMEVTPQR